MAQDRSPKDDKLIQDLYDKLNWFTYQASDEEFDEEQVRAILELLDKMDPLPEPEGGTKAAFRAQKDTADGKQAAFAASRTAEGASLGQALPDDPAAAFERFKKKYHITDEDLARKDGRLAEGGASDSDGRVISFPEEFAEEIAVDGSQVRRMSGKRVQMEVSGIQKDKKRGGRFLGSAWGKAAAAVIIVAAAGTYLSFGTSAVQQKSFFEIVQEGVNSLKFTVTGNVMESEEETEIQLEKLGKEPVYYNSWEEVAEENGDILIPGYIPEGMELDELFKQENSDYVFYNGIYSSLNLEDMLVIRVVCFSGNYAVGGLFNEAQWDLIKFDEDKDIKYYCLADRYMVLWRGEKCIYMFEWNSLDEIDKIIAYMNK